MSPIARSRGVFVVATGQVIPVNPASSVHSGLDCRVEINGDEASFETNGWEVRRRRLHEVNAERLNRSYRPRLRAEVLPKGQSLARHTDDRVQPSEPLAPPRIPRPSSCVWRYQNVRLCPGRDQVSRPQGASATRSLRLQCVYRRSELRHRLGRVPHAFEMDVELRRSAFVPDHDQIIILITRLRQLENASRT